MQITPRAVVLAAFGVGPLLLASGCGGSTPTGADATIANIQPTSFVEIPPATTTSTTTTLPQTDPVAGTRSPSEQTYEIKSGDGLGAIAARYDITLEQLINYNQFPDGAAQLILPGQVIKIPPDALVPGTATPTETETDTGGDTPTETEDTADEPVTGDDCPTSYVIKDGDTVRSRVADQFGITFQEMDAANANTPGYQNFIPGTEIVIPCPA
jgi:LysM repeat protein